MIQDHIAYPLASLVMVAVIAVVLTRVLPATPWYGAVASASWALVPLGLLVLLGIAPLLPSSWHVPGSGWSRHLDLAERWSRAVVAVHWRLTEEQGRALLGVDLAAMGSVLAESEAADHARMLAEWHLRSARRRLGMTAYTAAALILAIGGTVVLATSRQWMGHGV